MDFKRSLIKEIVKRINEKKSKVITIYGPRQVGKTTLVEEILQKLKKKKILRINGDSLKYREIISSQNTEKLGDFVKGFDILFIDEAQRIENIGVNLKILHDNFPNLKIIVTGSSALDLANSIKEPLTGRTYVYRLYPISTLELSKDFNNFELQDQLESRLIFGSYPEALNIKKIADKIEYLNNLAVDYLYKDVLELENVRFSNKLKDLLKLLALQIGNEVSYHEISSSLGLARQTVESYIDLLEKAFVVKRLHSFSRNLRKEVVKKPKIYFYDLGIRNALINNFSYLDSRLDVGAMWENFLVFERLKRNEYKKHFCSQYFWRTYTGAELDYVEEYDGKFYGYEFKWNKLVKNPPQSWIDEYQGKFECVNKENFLKFVL